MTKFAAKSLRSVDFSAEATCGNPASLRDWAIVRKQNWNDLNMAKLTSHWRSVLLVTVASLAIAARVFSEADKPANTAPAKNVDNAVDAQLVSVEKQFQKEVQPLLKKYCLRCHNVEKMTSGIRVDHLDGKLADKRLFLWKDIQNQIADEAMPPEKEPQPTAKERKFLTDWIRKSMIVARSRNRNKNGTIRRLTVSQYQNTLGDLLGLEDNLTDVLPPDSVSKDGFLNNGQTMLLSPLLLESYFDIAEKALDRCIVDEKKKPVIQNFRMDLGASINPKPIPERLILGANSLLLNNQNFMVSQVKPVKPFAYDPFPMRTKYDFIEGYRGNATVRGWRKYDSIYHAVFACMRGTGGYPKGLAYQAVPEGLLLRPAIPSAELFGKSSTYGPKANFKISLRELPDQGRFRVKVKAAKYEDGLLLDSGTKSQLETSPTAITVNNPTQQQTVNIPKAGIYQTDVYSQPARNVTIKPNATKLNEGLIGYWSLNGNATGQAGKKKLIGKLVGNAKFVNSPFGKAVSVTGKNSAVVIPRDNSMNVADGDFSVAAWIHPKKLKQGGIVCLGGYSWIHGWYLDMPNNKGVLRIETAKPGQQSNGTVQSQPGVIKANRWQHVAAVVRRGTNKTRLYVNGYQVAVGTINAANLDNMKATLHIGRIQNAQLFSGEIDEVRIYRRALDVAEIQALVQPGKQFARAPNLNKRQQLSVKLGNRQFSGVLSQSAFMTVRLPAGPLKISAQYGNNSPLNRIVFTPLKQTDELAKQFLTFEKRSPQLGVHVGLRRDCGSTLPQVGDSQSVSSNKLSEYIFEGAITNFPSPDVEKDNVNYLAGIREIGVRSEFTDGRDMPRLVIRSVEFEGPYYESWPPVTHKKIFIDSKNKDNPQIYAREIIRAFATRAFRRPVTKAEEASLFAVWKNAFSATGNFQQSVKDSLLVTLTSPQFLFIIENSATPKPENLDAYELASKLSYFLWNTGPDHRLLKLAATNKLHQSLDAEIKRMIQNPKFKQFTTEFTSQWLSLDKFDVVEVDRQKYPTLTRDTKTELRKEPVRFLQYLIRHNLPVKNLIQSDFILANEVVASYYGLADRSESGFKFRPIKHEDKHLGGVLSQASILAGLSDGRESNPVKRGAWLARKIIADPPDDPPPNVPALPEAKVKLTLRQRLERHRNQKGCMKCHSGIDPWGVPFEEFDAGGLFKKGVTVDARSKLPDKTEVANFNGLQAYLANNHIDRVAFSFLKHISSYAVGRTLTYNEIEFLKAEGVKLKPAGYRMEDMIRFVVKSKLFLEK
jgi:hypothetical protein